MVSSYGIMCLSQYILNQIERRQSSVSIFCISDLRFLIVYLRFFEVFIPPVFFFFLKKADFLAYFGDSLGPAISFEIAPSWSVASDSPNFFSNISSFSATYGAFFLAISDLVLFLSSLSNELLDISNSN